jgi:hypothetical protein
MRGLEVMFGEFIKKGVRDGGMAESMRKRNFAGPSNGQEIDTSCDSIELEERTDWVGNLAEDAGYMRQRMPMAGFGTRDEVVPLVVRRRYGIPE